MRLLTWDDGWTGRTLYNFAGQCGFRVSIQLVSDSTGKVAAIADINSDSVRPNPLHLEYWLAGGPGGLHIAQGSVAAVSATRATPLGTGGKPAPTMIRGNGLETFSTSYYDKYATYSGNGYRSSAVSTSSPVTGNSPKARKG